MPAAPALPAPQWGPGPASDLSEEQFRAPADGTWSLLVGLKRAQVLRGLGRRSVPELSRPRGASPPEAGRFQGALGTPQEHVQRVGRLCPVTSPQGRPGPQSYKGHRLSRNPTVPSRALATPCSGDAAAELPCPAGVRRPAVGGGVHSVSCSLSSRRGGRRRLPGAVRGVLGECPPGACLEQPRATVAWGEPDVS